MLQTKADVKIKHQYQMKEQKSSTQVKTLR